MRAKEIDREHVRGRLIISDELPQAADIRHHEALDKFIRQDGIELLVIDPAYLSLPADDNGNLFKQGELLRLLTNVCRDAGARSARIAEHQSRWVRLARMERSLGI